MNRLPQKMILIPEERYKRLTSPNTLQDSKETTQEVKEVNEVKELPIINSTLNSGIPIEDILKFLPMRKQSRARLIASYFDGSNNLQWNDNKEILYDNKPVVGSSIVDLLYDAVCPKRNYEPIGIKEFYHILKSNNLPQGLILNVNRHNLLSNSSSLPSLREWVHY